MQIDPSRAYAVITGNFIGFSDLPTYQREKMYFVLKRAGEALHTEFPGVMPFPIDMLRGDGWQTLIASSALSLRVVFLFALGF